MGFSVLTFTYKGSEDFDLNFSGGFTNRSDIKCYTAGEHPVEILFDWLTDSKVRIDSRNVVIGQDIVFTRTVSKTSLPVDYTAPGLTTRENIQTGLNHILYLVHEVLDGRIATYTQLSSDVQAVINAAVEAAIDKFRANAATKSEVVLYPTLTEQQDAITYTTGGLTLYPEEIGVFVNTPPSSDIEVLISNGAQVVATLNIDTLGAVQLHGDAVTMSSGPVSISVVGGNYNSGTDIVVVLPLYSSVDVDFNTVVDNYITVFEEARNVSE